ADLVEVPAVPEPRPRGRDVVGSGLALGLDQDGQLDEVPAVPPREGLEELEPLAVGRDLDLDPVAVGGGGLEAFLALGEAARGQLLPLRRGEAEGTTVRPGDGPV